MTACEDLTRGVYLVDAGYLRPRLAAFYLVVDAGEVAFIDTGTNHSLDTALAALKQLELSPEQVRYVIPTHVHLDHAGGAGAMMQVFPNADMVIHPRGARHMIDPEALVGASKAVYGEAAFERLYGEIVPVDEQRVRVAEDGDRLPLGQREFLFLDTPGHARHHFCLHDAVADGVFSGDTGGICYDEFKSAGRGLMPTTPPTQLEPEPLRQSFARIVDCGAERLFLTHFGEYRKPETQLDSYNAWIELYLEACRAEDPQDSDGEQRLERRLARLAAAELETSSAKIDAVLGGDIRLNAQGLAHWWRRRAKHE